MEGRAGDIFLDPSSGIGIEEQQEILAGIESLTGRSPMEERPGEQKIEAKKKGALFPLLVNGGAVILLAAGFFILSFLHAREDLSIRGSAAALGITERKLIQEIRKETAQRISQKEAEIRGMMSRLTEVDAEYQALQESMDREDALNSLQNQENLARLQSLQEDYRNSLSGLQEERTRMVEDSRTREAALRAGMEERVGALESELEEKEAGLAASLEALRTLEYDQDRARKAEGQMEGFYAALQNRIREGKPEEAAAVIRSAGEFLLAPSLQGIPAWENRKKAHRAALASLEALLQALPSGAAQTSAEAGETPEDATLPADLPAAPESADTIAGLREENAGLARKNEELERSLRAFSGGDQEKRLRELEASISELEAQSANRERLLDERDSAIASLGAKNGEQEARLAEKDQQIGELRAAAAELQETIDFLKTYIGQ
jgi:chromosome segregation ATPase